MRIGRNEIIEELSEHMRKCEGEASEWYVGVAETDSKFQIQDARLQIQDSRVTPSNMPGLAYREAHTAYAAADAMEYLVSAFGLRPAAEVEHRSDKQPSGRIVFVYRNPEAAARGPEPQSPVVAQSRPPDHLHA